jgi:hypothetical protein
MGAGVERVVRSRPGEQDTIVIGPSHDSSVPWPPVRQNDPFVRGSFLRSVAHIDRYTGDVCHERKGGADVEGRSDPLWCCAGDGGRSSGVALQGEASNHRKLRWLRAKVVSVAEKACR